MQNPVLIVYGNQETNRELRAIFETASIPYFSAGSGLRAVEIAVEKSAALVILGDTTRDIEGLECCRRLRKQKETQDIPIVFFHSKKDQSVRMRAFAAGASDFLLMPFEPSEVVARTRTHLFFNRLRTQSDSEMQFLRESNSAKDRLLRLYSRSGQLLQDSLTNRGHNTVMAAALGRVLEWTAADFAALAVYDGDSKLQYRYFAGMPELSKRFSVPLKPGAARELYARRKLVRVEDYETKGSIEKFKGVGFESMLAVPMGSNAELLGICHIFSRDPLAFTEDTEEHLWALAPALAASAVKADFEERTMRLAAQEPVTDLLNRQFGMRALSAAIAKARTSGRALAAAVLAVDDLYGVNHRYGIRCGDAVLQSVARSIREAGLGENAFRIGNRIFVFPDGLNDSKLLAAVRGLQSRLAVQTMAYRNQEFKFTVSAALSVHRTTESAIDFYSRLDDLLSQGLLEEPHRLVVEK